jgi:hypothetical protein
MNELMGAAALDPITPLMDVLRLEGWYRVGAYAKNVGMAHTIREKQKLLARVRRIRVRVRPECRTAK